MLDWLKRDPRAAPCIEVAGQRLPVIVRRLGHARRMTLRLAPGGGEVRVSMPQWARTADALAFARSRTDWLESQLAALPVQTPLIAGGTLPYRGSLFTIAHDERAPRHVVLAEGKVHVGGPTASFPGRLRRWLEKEAQALCSEDLAYYCARAGKSPPRLALSNAQRRWGSCGPDGAIRINWRLAMAPDFVRRSVVAHEVAHLVHFDHSPRFHALLTELYECDIAEANRWLKAKGRTLYAPFG